MLTDNIVIDGVEIEVEYYIYPEVDRNSHDGCGEKYEIEIESIYHKCEVEFDFEEVKSELKKHLAG